MFVFNVTAKYHGQMKCRLQERNDLKKRGSNLLIDLFHLFVTLCRILQIFFFLITKVDVNPAKNNKFCCIQILV